MKTRLKYLVVILILLVIPLISVKALSVSKNDITMEDGTYENVELYANTENQIISVSFTMVYSTYDIPAYFAPANDFDDTTPSSITHEVIFNEAKTGKITLGTVSISVVENPTDASGTISIHTATAKTTNGETINLDPQTINVKVGTPPKEEPKSVLLSKIESKIVKIDLKKDVYEYNVNIKKDVEELDFKAIPEDENAKVEISSQKISELKDNKIIITVKNGNTEKEYTLNIKIKETDDDIAIDKTEFKENKSYKGKWIIISIFLIIAMMVSLIMIKKK